MRFQFSFSLVMQFQFFSVYCVFFLHAKIRYGGKAGWGIEGDRTTCARIIFRETDETARLFPLRTALGSRVQILFERNRRRRRRLAIGGIRRSRNASLTTRARNKKHITNTYRQGCRYVIAGVIGQQLSTIGQQFFFSTPFYWATIIDN